MPIRLFLIPLWFLERFMAALTLRSKTFCRRCRGHPDSNGEISGINAPNQLRLLLTGHQFRDGQLVLEDTPTLAQAVGA